MRGTIIFSAVYLAVLAAYLFLWRKRGWVKSVLSLAEVSASFCAAYLLARNFVSSRGGAVSDVLKDSLLDVLNLRTDAMVRDTAMTTVSSFVASAIIGMVAFLALFLIFWGINAILKRLIFRLVTKEKYKSFVPKKRLWGLNAAAKLLAFAVVSVALLYPLGAASDIMCSAAESVQISLPQSVLTNPISRVHGAVGRLIFDRLTDSDNDDIQKNSDEIQRGAEIYLAVEDMSRGGDPDKNVERVCTSLRSSYILTDFTSEIVVNAANSWRNGQQYMYNTLEIPEGRNGELVKSALEVLSTWQRENLLQDIDTALNVYKLLRAKGITGIDDSQALLKALEDDGFAEDLFLEFSQNKDFIAIIPKIMHFGIGSAVDAMKLKIDDEFIVDFEPEELSEADWRGEAKAFATLLRRMDMVEAITKGKYNFSSLNFRELMDDFNELRQSKLLSNILINILIQTVASL